MPFEFQKIKGLDSETAKTLDENKTITDSIASYIEQSTANRVDVAKSEFKLKMDALNKKLRDSESAAEELKKSIGSMGVEEIEALKASQSKAPELQATLDALNKKYDDALKDLEGTKAKLQSKDHASTIGSAIQEYNTAHPTVAVKDDMTDVVAMLAKDAVRLDEASGEYRVYNSKGEIIATDKGAATPIDWLQKLREERPSFFKVPAGSGASGSGPQNGSKKKFAEMSESERIALYEEDPEAYRKSRDQAV